MGTAPLDALMEEITAMTEEPTKEWLLKLAKACKEEIEALKKEMVA